MSNKTVLKNINLNGWFYFGMIFLFVVSSITILGGSPSVVRPSPFYLIILSLFISYFSIFAMPLLYTVSFLFIYNIGNSIAKFRYVVILISIFNFFDIYMSWNYGVKINGIDYVQKILFINIIAFVILIFLSEFAYRKNLKRLFFFNNLYLFFLLSWCAFPYLGELP